MADSTTLVIDTCDGESDDENEEPEPFFHNPRTGCRDLVLTIMVPWGMSMQNFRAIQFNQDADEATIEYETDNEWASITSHRPANCVNEAWSEIFHARVYVDNEIARSSMALDAPIWCSMKVDLPSAVYTRPEHYMTQEMKKTGVVYSVSWTLR
ncbi:hypothetical protein SARC_04042 [Sphaeroforma arctica JP610]|uniref:Uncharacterized protein n=1 Tax=Sphaeroforma arctica JP610 TaxID=667725 RepID=A0A0L0G3M8_9EUKA|nr:hypothetical protein SARC_04042 [Sphaeroforma arctica JP610]KNC83712.1 hypothetical protein SARC_04042 [Sphaeroforma arctica JP610]|eukprot:XP_014157614.1 hypothetical protein SARC_04042 [Sphaeroforma arctica JP610]